MPVEFTEYEIQELKKRGVDTPEQLDEVRHGIEDACSAFRSCVYELPAGKSSLGDPPSVERITKENVLRTAYGVKSRSDVNVEGLFRWAERSRRDAGTEG